MVATTTALIAMGIASAAGSAAKAKIESNAAKKAAGQQQTGIDNALAFQRQMWGQQQQAYQPYMNMGAPAAGMLGALMHAPGTPGGYQPGMNFNPAASGPLVPAGGLSRGTLPSGGPGLGMAMQPPQRPAPSPLDVNVMPYGAVRR